MRRFLVAITILSMVVMADDDSWLWTGAKILGFGAAGFVAGPVILGGIGFT